MTPRQNESFKYNLYYNNLSMMLIGYKTKIIRTGSMVFGDFEDGSDWDYVLFFYGKDKDEVIGILTCMGFRVTTDTNYIDTADHIMFRSEDEKINLIVPLKKMLFNAWSDCTWLAQKYQVSKNDRKKMFDAVINRGPCENDH